MDKITERDKYLAGHVGDEWHELTEPYLCTCGYKPSGNCKGLECQGCMEVHIDCAENPTYHTAEGRQRLLEWAVEQEWWELFKIYQWVVWYTDRYRGRGESIPPKYRNGVITTQSGLQRGLPDNLLIPKDALAIAVERYLKGLDSPDNT